MRSRTALRKSARIRAPRKTAHAKARASAPKPSPREVMLFMIGGYWVSRLIFVAARLGLADALAEKPLTPEALAGRVGAHADNLYRALRGLASMGIFAELPDGRFRLTPLARVLQSNAKESLRDFALMMIDDYNWQAVGALEHAIVTGGNPFEHVHKTPLFRFLQDHPDKERVFAAAMASVSAEQIAAVAQAYPFGTIARLVDVGGAHGHMLAEILRRHKSLKGVLYDQPKVVAEAEASGFVTAPDIRGRCTIEGGDFFHSVPVGADGYIMKYIVHDWDDERCVRILKNCRDAMAKGGRVLVVDAVIPGNNAKNWTKLIDIAMMALTGGKERTREEFRDIFARAGLRLTRVIPTKSDLSIVEAVAR
jgi:hypothetical protein